VLVEDNPADASLVRRALEEHGVSGHLTLLTDGEKAITFIRTLEDPSVGCPDLAIIDLNLPRRSGREVLEAMRRNQRLLQVPAVILSSSDAENDRTGSLKLGASRYITKPTRLDDFLSIGGILRDVLEQRSS
jgi:DNA-binding response OmpR family regulator